MRRIFTGFLAAGVLTGSLLLAGPALAQSGDPGSTATTERPAPVFPWVFAALCTIGILLIMCMPTRKAP